MTKFLKQFVNLNESPRWVYFAGPESPEANEAPEQTEKQETPQDIAQKQKIDAEVDQWEMLDLQAETQKVAQEYQTMESQGQEVTQQEVDKVKNDVEEMADYAEKMIQRLENCTYEEFVKWQNEEGEEVDVTKEDFEGYRQNILNEIRTFPSELHEFVVSIDELQEATIGVTIDTIMDFAQESAASSAEEAAAFRKEFCSQMGLDPEKLNKETLREFMKNNDTVKVNAAVIKIRMQVGRLNK